MWPSDISFKSQVNRILVLEPGEKVSFWAPPMFTAGMGALPPPPLPPAPGSDKRKGRCVTCGLVEVRQYKDLWCDLNLLYCVRCDGHTYWRLVEEKPLKD